jgi:quercetin dioxygenase-like cupin family protein|tara:strand:- start:75 stop:383 length:309 start_codon:yes stop_codon:yes gene_type:complete
MQHLKYSELEWEDTSNPKIQKSTIWSNSEMGGTTFWKVPQGEKFPKHGHKGYEHIYLTEGVMEFSGVILQKGDFLCTSKGEVHEAIALEDSVILVMNERKNS